MMESLDKNCIYKISAFIDIDLKNCLLVCSQWKTIFKEHYDILKPKQSHCDIKKKLCNSLKLGEIYNISNSLYMYKYISNYLTIKEKSKIDTMFKIKLALDKPKINYYPLVHENIILKDLQDLKLS